MWKNCAADARNMPTRYAAALGLEALAPMLDLESIASNEPESQFSLQDYDVLEKIDEGGMGVVYKARQRSLDRLVALKFLACKTLFATHHRQRFQREARLLAQLTHDNIVPIYEANFDGGRPYFAMQLVGGGSLARNLPELQQDLRRGVRIMESVARAVAYAHEQGVLHRDLKPANILLEKEKPLVSDFGLAKLMDDAALVTIPDAGVTLSLSQRLNHSSKNTVGVQPGTPAYMAPEQFDSQQFGMPGIATDVWAIGVILYELATGIRPFDGVDFQAISRHVREEAPTKPRKLRPSCKSSTSGGCIAMPRKGTE